MTAGSTPTKGLPLWVLVAGVVTVIVAALAALAVYGGQTLPERTGPPVEELGVERTVFAPGTITVTVRNTGPDPVQVAQVFVNDTYVDFTGPDVPIGRLQSAELVLSYPWATGQPYEVAMLTSTGLVIEHSIAAAVATPTPTPGFFGLMTLLGVYVGVIPVLLGMLVLPVVRRSGTGVVRFLLGLTVGLLLFLAVDALLEGLELAAGQFGGPLLVLLGAGLAYLALLAVDRVLAGRTGSAGPSSGMRLAVLIAVGIGLHNLGEGLVIGSSYAVGELALGATLVAGFALHNTTEGLAIVSPLAARRPPVWSLVGLGVLAGAPAILGAVVGASVENAALSALLFGVGVGAIAQVVTAILPGLGDRGSGRPLDLTAVTGLGAGVVVMFLTGLLVVA